MELQQAKLVRKNRMEYDALAKVQLPPFPAVLPDFCILPVFCVKAGRCRCGRRPALP